MSSKASEILGVSARHPRSAHRGNAPSRDGTASRASQASKQTANTGNIPFDNENGVSTVKRPRTKRFLSDKSAGPSPKMSMDSMQPSVRFADSSVSRRESTSSIRTPTTYDTALPEISRRPAPSAWRGLSSKGSNTWKAVSQRTSEESIGSKRRDDSTDSTSRNKNLLRNAFSRLTLRSSRSGASLSDQPGSRTQQSSAWSTAWQSTVTTARQSRVTTARPSVVNTATATPRALSPNRTEMNGASDAANVESTTDEDQPARKAKRINSRMPIDIITNRPPTKNWVDEMENLDLDDAKPSGRVTPADGMHFVSHDPVREDFQNAFHAPTQYGAFYRPDIAPQSSAPPRPQLKDYFSDRQSLLSAQSQYLPSNVTQSRTVVPRRKENSRNQPYIPSSSHSILNLSDSEEELHSVYSQDTVEARYGSRQQYGTDTSSLATAAAMETPLRKLKLPAKERIQAKLDGYKAPAAILSVLRMDEEQDDSTVTSSIPSLIESGSSRQSSSVSAKSYSRSFRTEPNQVPNFSVPRVGKYSARPTTRNQPGTPTNDDFPLPLNSEDGSKLQGLATPLPLEDDDILPKPSSAGNNTIMASISPEEAALLNHIRRQRTQALRQLQTETSTLATATLNTEKSDSYPLDLYQKYQNEASIASTRQDEENNVNEEQLKEDEVAVVEEEEAEQEMQQEQQEESEDEEAAIAISHFPRVQSQEKLKLALENQRRLRREYESRKEDDEREAEEEEEEPPAPAQEEEKGGREDEELDVGTHTPPPEDDPTPNLYLSQPHAYEEPMEFMQDDQPQTAQEQESGHMSEMNPRAMDEELAPESRERFSQIYRPTAAQAPLEQASSEAQMTLSESNLESSLDKAREEPSDQYLSNARNEDKVSVLRAAEEHRQEVSQEEYEYAHQEYTSQSRLAMQASSVESGTPVEDPDSNEDSSTPQEGAFKPWPGHHQNAEIRQRQRSIPYLEARSRFEKIEQSQPKSSMLPIRRRDESIPKEESSSNGARPAKNVSHIPRLRQIQTGFSRPTSLMKTPEAQESRQHVATHSRDGTPRQYTDYVSAPSPSSRANGYTYRPSSVYAAGAYIGNSSESEGRSESRNETYRPSNNGTGNQDNAPGLPSEGNSADDGDDEMAEPSGMNFPHISRQGNRNSGAKYVMHAWQALGGGQTST